MVGSYNRYISKKKALRKKRIADEIYTDSFDKKKPIEDRYNYYDNLHEYSKNKIHCSCPLCRAKTKSTGAYHWNISTRKGYNFTISDLKKQERMDADELDNSENM